MRQTQTRQSRPQRRGESAHFTERAGRRNERTHPGYEEDESREDWDYGEEDYRSENPYSEEESYDGEEYSEEYEREKGERPSRRSRKPTTAVGSRRRRASSELETYETKRPRRTIRSITGRRGFAAMPRSEVRRIAATGGHASHGGSSISTPARKRAPLRGRSRRTRAAARGFAAMPASEVRRIAAMGGRASHGGGRPAGRKARSRKTSRASRY